VGVRELQWKLELLKKIQKMVGVPLAKRSLPLLSGELICIVSFRMGIFFLTVWEFLCFGEVLCLFWYFTEKFFHLSALLCHGVPCALTRKE
jgi:hypothetical protein